MPRAKHAAAYSLDGSDVCKGLQNICLEKASSTAGLRSVDQPALAQLSISAPGM